MSVAVKKPETLRRTCSYSAYSHLFSFPLSTAMSVDLSGAASIYINADNEPTVTDYNPLGPQTSNTTGAPRPHEAPRSQPGSSNASTNRQKASVKGHEIVATLDRRTGELRRFKQAFQSLIPGLVALAKENDQIRDRCPQQFGIDVNNLRDSLQNWNEDPAGSAVTLRQIISNARVMARCFPAKEATTTEFEDYVDQGSDIEEATVIY